MSHTIRQDAKDELTSLFIATVVVGVELAIIVACSFLGFLGATP